MVNKLHWFAASLRIELLFYDFHRVELYFGNNTHFSTEVVGNLLTKCLGRGGSSYFDKNLIGEDFIIADLYDVVLHLGKLAK